MFEISVNKDDLLIPLNTVAGAVDRKQSLAILSNFYLMLKDNILTVSATDLEIEIAATLTCSATIGEAAITAPAKKMLDIVRSLDDGSIPVFRFDDKNLTIKHGRSSFKLSTLPAESYPNRDDEQNDLEIQFSRQQLVNLLQMTQFAMSQQDVRFFLNGLYMEFEGEYITAVATDGHRMAIVRAPVSIASSCRLLLPRKGVIELLRLLNHIADENIVIAMGKSHFKVTSSQYSFTSKLIDSRFPPYQKAIPKTCDKSITIDGQLLKKALQRILILANEKLKGVLLHMQDNQITLIANNQEHDEAVETLEAKTVGSEIKLGLNAGYLADVLNHFADGPVLISLSGPDNSILVESTVQADFQYIIMPMKI